MNYIKTIIVMLFHHNEKDLFLTRLKSLRWDHIHFQEEKKSSFHIILETGQKLNCAGFL